MLQSRNWLLKSWRSTGRIGNPLRSRTRLRIQPLEARDVPAIFTVSNLLDTGAGSLRQAILDANGLGGQDAISFKAGVTGTIPLASTLSITDSVVINGPGSAALSVSGQNNVRPFTISNSNASAISVLIFDMTVTNGKSTGNNGGGIFTDNESVRLDRVVVSNCTTNASGGGVAVSTGGNLFLQDSTITGNTATGGGVYSNRGGGVYFFDGGALNMQGCTLMGNSATGANGGGGLYFFGAPAAIYGGVTVSNCTIVGNTAPIGGGIALRQLNTAANPVVIQNNTITGNFSTTTSTTLGYGGGGLNVVSSGSPSILVRSNVLSGNSATAANGRSDIATFVELSLNNNAIGDTDGVSFKPGSGSNLINQSLFLNSLSSNGGLTQTISFAANSPLRNAGSNLGALSTDQRGPGFPRIIDSTPDIGAFELPMITVKNLNDSDVGSLRQAILDSNASTALTETIVFQSGLTGTINLGSQLLISDDLIITGPGASVISVSGQNAVRVFDITDNNDTTAIDVTVSGLTVTAGRTGSGFADATGGGIRVANESLTLDSVVVSNCNAMVPDFGQGGGIDVGLNGDLIVRNSTITGNSTVGNGNGGGGGINMYGGGFGFAAGSNLLIENSTISNNISNEAGGGIFFIGDVGAGGITIRNSTISGNSALNGGGLRLRSLDTTLGGVLIQNSTFTGNRATNTATFSSDGGGGMQLTSLNPYTVTISSTIVADNTSANGRDDITTESGVTLDVSHSALGDPDGFTINGTNSNNLPFGTPLGLLPLANNAGPTKTVAFAANSPLLNAGSNPAGLTIDQRGLPRVANGAPDIGAFEATVFTVTHLIDDVSLGSLRFALQVANLTDDPEVIVFQPGLTGTINLGSTLAITRSVSIGAPVAPGVVISGQNARRVFIIDDGNTSVINVAIAGLTVTGGNSNAVGRGGGLFITNEYVALDRVVVTNNVGVQGGGIGVDADGQLTVRNSTIANNSTSFGNGGGIHFDFRGSLLLENSTVATNTASGGHGGGISFSGSVLAGGFTVRNSTITGNSATDGGGICFYYSPTPFAPILIQNSTITNNHATTSQTGAGRGGGGIALRGPNTGTVNIVSAIISGNTATNGRSDVASQASQPNINFSAIGDPDGFTRSATSDNNLADGATLGLGTLANNGGPTQTIAFAANSPLVNAGSNPANLTTDQRGGVFARVQGTATDIGAFELPSFVVLHLNDSGAGSLRQAILNANATPGTAETITFQSGLTGTITLASTLSITDSVTILGPGTANLSVSGNNLVRPFTIDNPSAVIDVSISGLTVTNGKIINANGGGLFNANEKVTLDQVVVQSNASTGSGNGAGSGAGIAVGTGGVLTVRNSTVSGNSASNRGGGIYFYSGGSLLLENSTVSGNSAADANGGGGVYFFGTVAAGGVTIRNSTIAANTAPSGGGLALNSLNTVAAPVLIQNSTFTANSATTNSTTAGQGGGGIAMTTSSAATITIVSTIVSGNIANTANSRSDIAIPNTATVNVNFSAIGDPDGFTRSGTSNNNLADGVALNLGSLTNNGGPTQTILPAANSAVVGKGSNTGLNTDQRGPGFGRVRTTVDIGAVEAPTPFVVTTNADAGTGSLRLALTDANAFTGADAVTFDPTFFNIPRNITLTSKELTIADAVTIAGPSATLVTVSGNNALRIFNTTSTPVGTEITLSGLTLTKGFTDDEGGVISAGSQKITLTDCVLTGNTAVQEGGVFDTSYADGGSLTLTRCLVTNNTANNNDAGALNFDSNGWTLTIIDSTLSGNTAAGEGGAIYILNGSLSLQGSTLSANISATSGGGLYFTGTVGTGGLTVANSTLSGNKAASGGGIELSNAAGTLTVRNSTITSNSATGDGGGIHRSGGSATITLVNTIVSGNTATSTGPEVLTTGTVNATTSLLGNTVGISTFNGDSTTNDIIGANPRFAPLGNYGGKTPTHALLPGSAAVNAGSTADPIDQRGLGRVGAPDIGAIESQGFVLTPSGSGQSAKINTAFANPLKVTVTPSNALEPVDGGVIGFLPPFSGASASLSPVAVTISGGSASTTATANATVGSYNVTAFAGVTTTALFALTNTGGATSAKVSMVVVGDGTNQRSLVSQLKVTFDAAITFSGVPAAAFELNRNKDSKAVNLAVSMDGTNTTATLTFTGGAVDGKSLADGIYTLKVLASQIAGGGLDGNSDGKSGDNFMLVGSTTAAPKLFRLFGDADGNATVNAADFAAFRSFFGLSGPSIFDFDGNNQTNASDFAQFRGRFGITLV